MSRDRLDELYAEANVLYENNATRPEAMEVLIDMAEKRGLTAIDAAEAWKEAERTKGEAEHVAAELLVTERMSEVKPTIVRWLWPHRIALGKYVMIAGDPDLGKTCLWCDLAARITTGTRWPDGGECARGSVLFATSEDGIADTISPRLIAAGADLRKVQHIKGVKRTGEDGIERDARLTFASVEAIKSTARQMPDLMLLVLDPQDAYIGNIQASKNAKVRAGIEPLIKLAEARGFTLLGLSHPNKSLTQVAHHRLMDSIGWVAAARQVHVVAADPEDDAENHADRRRLFLPLKNNLARNIGGLAYTIQAKKLPQLLGATVPVIRWEDGAVDTTAAQVLTVATPTRETKKDEAVEFLRGLLADGEVSARIALAKGKDAGFSTSAIHRARQAMGVTTRKDGQGGWVWKLKSSSESLKCSVSLKPSKLKYKNSNKSNNSKIPRFHVRIKGKP